MSAARRLVRCAALLGSIVGSLVGCESNEPDPGASDPTGFTLPVAAAAEPDKGDEPHDRVGVDLDRSGRIHAGKVVTLAGLAARISRYAENYNSKKTGAGWVTRNNRRWSKLFVRLDADENTPWRHVRWILGVFHEQGYYKLLFGVRRREPSGHWGNKLTVFLPTSVPEGTPTRIRLWATDNGLVCAVDGKRVRLEHLSRGLQGQQIEIDAAPDVAYKHVIAVVSRLIQSNVKDIRFRDLAPPLPEMRDKTPLPD